MPEKHTHTLCRFKTFLTIPADLKSFSNWHWQVLFDSRGNTFSTLQKLLLARLGRSTHSLSCSCLLDQTMFQDEKGVGQTAEMKENQSKGNSINIIKVWVSCVCAALNHSYSPSQSIKMKINYPGISEYKLFWYIQVAHKNLFSTDMR